MSNAKVIEFPKEKSSRVLMRNKIREKKATVGLSIASVVLCAVFLNQWMMNQNSGVLGVAGNRGVASFDAASLQKDIRWEHNLAKKISQDSELNPAAIAHSPTLRDDLVFGYLEGRYGMKTLGGQITSLEFLSIQAGDTPSAITDKVSFLKKYSEAIGLAYSDVSPAVDKAEGQEVYNLIDSSKRIIGTAHFHLDGDGRVKVIKFVN